MTEARMPDGEPVAKYWERVTLQELERRGHKVSDKEWQRAKNWERRP